MSTRDRLIEVAEELFATRGFGGSSAREITRAAGVNLAAINYHFENKDGLLRAIVLDRSTILNEERLRMLEVADRDATPDPPAVRAILVAFIEPVIRIRTRFPHFPALLSRVMLENLLPTIGEVFRSSFHPCFERFAEALGRALPDGPARVIRWRLLFTVGVFHFTLSNGEILKLMLGAGAADSMEELTDLMVGYCEGGFLASHAPIPRGSGSEGGP